VSKSIKKVEARSQ